MEIVVCASEASAGRAGFREGSRRHSQEPSLVAWWPALGEEPLRGLSIHRVTFLTDQPHSRFNQAEARALAYLKSRCDGLWLSAAL